MVAFLSEKNRFPMFSIGWIMVTGSILAQREALVGGKWECCRGGRYFSRGEREESLPKEAPWRHKIYASALMSVREEGIIMQGQLQGCALLSGEIRSLAMKDKEGRNDRVNENPMINPFRLSSPQDERWKELCFEPLLLSCFLLVVLGIRWRELLLSYPWSSKRAAVSIPWCLSPR